MTFRILTVCTGNICRSAMAKMVFEQRFAEDGLDVQVDSAGVSAEEQGNPIDYRAAQVLRENGYEVTGHRARQVQPGELADYDLVLAATGNHLGRLRGMAAADATAATNTGAASAASAASASSADFASASTTASSTTSGAGPAQNLHLMRDFDTAGVGADMPDPWYGDMDDFVETLATIERIYPQIAAEVRAAGATS
ncbi:low molecular weight protein-tyrosine-phosphatase [Boudabousia marimammalium]|uniref:protein-tyrosine-phosphatase n=1 Tax=Boudabousia marimammalium TaxID=156892 RepID=A0A1Q5PSV1_9ACTO|nr:low molecular weight protein-tyrosine-phosphatase [Boudabousia marimammalium]OKL50623.1 hypothetical protein BM477_01330 [Boudabousia marimammalium]